MRQALQNLSISFSPLPPVVPWHWWWSNRLPQHFDSSESVAAGARASATGGKYSQAAAGVRCSAAGSVSGDASLYPHDMFSDVEGEFLESASSWTVFGFPSLVPSLVRRSLQSVLAVCGRVRCN